MKLLQHQDNVYSIININATEQHLHAAASIFDTEDQAVTQEVDVQIIMTGKVWREPSGNTVNEDEQAVGLKSAILRCHRLCIQGSVQTRCAMPWGRSHSNATWSTDRQRLIVGSLTIFRTASAQYRFATSILLSRCTRSVYCCYALHEIPISRPCPLLERHRPVWNNGTEP